MSTFKGSRLEGVHHTIISLLQSGETNTHYFSILGEFITSAEVRGLCFISSLCTPSAAGEGGREGGGGILLLWGGGGGGGGG